MNIDKPARQKDIRVLKHCNIKNEIEDSKEAKGLIVVNKCTGEGK